MQKNYFKFPFFVLYFGYSIEHFSIAFTFYGKQCYRFTFFNFKANYRICFYYFYIPQKVFLLTTK